MRDNVAQKISPHAWSDTEQERQRRAQEIIKTSTVVRRMSEEEACLNLPESAMDEIVKRLEARLDGKRREQEGRSEAELGEHSVGRT